MAGIFSPSPENFSQISVSNGVDQLASTAADQFIRDMKTDLESAATAGVVNLAEIGKRIEEGASASDVIGSGNIGPEMTALVKDIDRRAQSGEKFKTLQDLSDGYVGGGGATFASTKTDDAGELSFGGVASPGEGADSIEVDRRPSSHSIPGLTDDGDVFHGAYTGTIFDIVTHRLKAQKGNYAELDPEGRMNRLFNGYEKAGSRDRSAR
jgi:HPt (histidine-containing phosphotransfer) domain-containing protein